MVSQLGTLQGKSKKKLSARKIEQKWEELTIGTMVNALRFERILVTVYLDYFNAT